MSDNQMSLYVSYEMLARALGLPGGATIGMVLSDPRDILRKEIHLVVEHPSFPPRLEGAAPYAARNVEDLVRRAASPRRVAE